MQKITYDDQGLSSWISPEERHQYLPALESAETMLDEKKGPGNDFLGWLHLPRNIATKTIDTLSEKAAELREKSDVMICIGVGGSYLGAKAAVEFLSPSLEELRAPKVLFAGHTVNSDYLSDLLTYMQDREISVNVISKSGTTTEPGIAFRVIREWMEKKYSRTEAASRIVATTDPHKGALRALAETEGYATFPIPPDVGGRFSVLTPVGLLPIAYAGINIYDLIEGAGEAMGFCSGMDMEKNRAARYAVNRNILFRRGKLIEMLAVFQPQLRFIGEWWKQLAGESEGKDSTGIFPASVEYTPDLHSMGQWMQDGVRSIFETFVFLKKTLSTLSVPRLGDNGDGLDYLAGRSFETINENAYRGTLIAHLDGGVPCSTVTVEDRSPRSLGQLIYFFEKAIAVSGYILRVNPFDQPGVEAYKKNMFALLSKPGFEDQTTKMHDRLRSIGL